MKQRNVSYKVDEALTVLVFLDTPKSEWVNITRRPLCCALQGDGSRYSSNRFICALNCSREFNCRVVVLDRCVTSQHCVYCSVHLMVV
jgi:hypothetical protein